MINPLVLTILGMGIVFVVLFVINLMIVAFGKIFAEKEIPIAPPIPSAPIPAAPVPNASAQEDEEVIAAIMAAVYSYMGTSPSGLTVRPMIRSNAQSAWSNAGKTENMLLR